MPGSASARMGLQAIAGADAANTIDTTSQALVTALDGQTAIFSQGIFASRPTSTPGTPGKTGRLYYATDTGTLFYDFGTGWIVLNDVAAYATIQKGAAYLDVVGSGAPFLLADVGGKELIDGVAAGAATQVPAMSIFYFDPADHLAPGRVGKLRVRATLANNNTAPAVNFTVGLYPVTGVGVYASTIGAVTGAVVSGSTVAFNTPAANALLQGQSGEFSAPAAGFYALAVVASGTSAAGSLELVRAELRLRQAFS